MRLRLDIIKEQNRILNKQTGVHKFVFSPRVRAGLRLYDFLWRIGKPFLRLNQRLWAGWDERCGVSLPRKADLWLHAASAGEAYLVHEIIAQLPQKMTPRILVTTNTRQGMDIINRLRHDPVKSRNHFDLITHYFPFDRPGLTRKVVDSIQPAVMGILETELWPGLLAALKSRKIPTVIVNGRLNPNSLKRYRMWPSFWKEVAPSNVLAVSEDDAARFDMLFSGAGISIETMPNIKFDQWYRQLGTDNTDNSLTERMGLNVQRIHDKLVVLGSIRQEEESHVLKMIGVLKNKIPDAVMALFPRHMHRLNAWQNRLTDNRMTWVMRSKISNNVISEDVILWDTFGELREAYAMATAVFIGGSLFPLGGQNFLEPMAYGIKPVIGPSWHNFAWVGESVFNKDLVYRASDWRDAVEQMIMLLKCPVPRDVIMQQAKTYAKDRCGGAAQVGRFFQRYFN